MDPTSNHLALDEAIKHSDCLHVAHGMVWFEDPQTTLRYGLMLMRSDSRFGFPGGGVDESVISKEHILKSLEREFEEEINAKGINFTEKDHLISQIIPSQSTSTYIMSHFFIKQITKDQFQTIEENHMDAPHFVEETLGVVRVPIGGRFGDSEFTPIRFLKGFLNHTFAGTARQHLIMAIQSLKSIDEDDMEQLRQQHPDILVQC